MKKRFKLITTIASLCLAVALMAFGVYAATNASFTVTSTINFSTSGDLVGTATVEAFLAYDNEGTITKVDDTADATGTSTVNYEGATDVELTTPLAVTSTNCYVIYEVTYERASETTSHASITISNFTVAASDGYVDINKGGVTSQDIVAGSSKTETAASITAKYSPVAASTANESFVITFDVALNAIA